MYYCEGNLVLNLVQSLQSIHTIVANCFKLEDNCLMDLVQFKVSISSKIGAYSFAIFHKFV